MRRSRLSVPGKVCGKVSLQTDAKDSNGKRNRGRLTARRDNEKQRKATKSRSFARTGKPPGASPSGFESPALGPHHYHRHRVPRRIRILRDKELLERED